MIGRIWLVSGVPGAGKSSVARALCARLQRSVHVEVDDLRHMVKNGYLSPSSPPSEEQRVQLRIARRTAAEMAALHAEAGFDVVVDDLASETDLADYLPYLGGLAMICVLLAPAMEIALLRNDRRPLESNPVARTALEAMIRRLHGTWLADHEGWLVLDSGALTVDETVEALLDGSTQHKRSPE